MTQGIEAAERRPVEEFLERIQVSAADLEEFEKGSIQLLELIVEKTTKTIPFEQLDVVLGRGIKPDIETTWEKIVRHKRGGYCFESATLMNEVLPKLGFTNIRAALGRVILGGRIQGMTHMVNIVKIGENEEFVVDCAFGANSPRKPISLNKGTRPQIAFPDAFRIIPDSKNEFVYRGFIMQSWDGSAWFEANCPQSGTKEHEDCWKNQYTFQPDAPVHEADVKLGNFYVSSFMDPTNWFTNTRLCTVHTDKGRKTLAGDSLSIVERIHSRDLKTLFSSEEFFDKKNVDDDDESKHEQNPIQRITEKKPLDQYLETLHSTFQIQLNWDHRNGGETEVQIENFYEKAIQ